ncbi:aminoacyl-tRNA hydrolase [Pelagibaculum spongiae]|uniref:Peptidyl-tRNA hydrolase n=1 Tax=Pelagibaculum spongiae TaxID=2080658 RepID=A0A2V1H7Q8_9GAMM|nr:aminoacyl-tRNA hydrolase [Pelagibaculum spongiae]PVZ72532.1 aminoacyl-tRNA hydrolase [Pelagibaculum spongiae]
MGNSVKLIVGLGNPGPDYSQTRHNAGVWFLEALAKRFGQSLQAESRFHGMSARIQSAGIDCRLLFPTDFMNRSGTGVAALANFFKITPEEILVIHDELDLEPGIARLKVGGGHGGHNGLRDIVKCLGNNKNFMRLRLGIGHPGDKNRVASFVLNRPTGAEEQQIERAIDDSLDVSEALLGGDWQKAMNQLHTRSK